MNRPHKILVFDSGAGGLSVARELLKKLPPFQLVYASDKAYFPYGDKSDEALLARIGSQMRKLLQLHSPDIVVIACNTASTIALDMLRATFKCPFVGVVPAIKPAAKLTKTGVIGVLATPATSNRQYTHQLIEDFAGNNSVIIHGSKALVSEAENKLYCEQVKQNVIQEELEILFAMPKGEKIDTIVLACTHFPLLRDEMKAVTQRLSKNIQWVDSGEAIARRVASLLEQPILTEAQTESLQIQITDCDERSDHSLFAKAWQQYLCAF